MRITSVIAWKWLLWATCVAAMAAITATYSYATGAPFGPADWALIVGTAGGWWVRDVLERIV